MAQPIRFPEDADRVIAMERGSFVDDDDLRVAIAEFRAKLPGWWFSVCECSVSRDASCGPDRNGPDASLLSSREFDEGFSADLYAPDATMADALREVMEAALTAKARRMKEGM